MSKAFKFTIFFSNLKVYCSKICLYFVKFSVLVFFAEQISAQNPIYLTIDSVLWTAKTKITFAGNSFVKINDKQKVIHGILKYQRYLWTKQHLIKFKAGSEISFDNQGNVVTGVLANNMNLRTKSGFVNFKKGKPVKFDSGGKLISGYLLRNTYLNSGKLSILFKEDSYILFDEKGNVIEGVLAQKYHLECSDGKSRNIKRGTFVKFNQKYQVIYRNK